MNLQAYPLYWPTGWKRTAGYRRQNARFSRDHKAVTIADGVQRILATLERMNVSRQDVIISTNVRTRLDGLPRSGEREPDDPGAAVYWRKSYGAPMRCMAIDRYTTCADNLAAISATLEAMRAIERHGGAEILDRTFQGFAALGDGSHKSWREVLGIQDSRVTRQMIEDAFRKLARIHHPDAGGDTGRFQEISAARDEALNEVK